MFVDTNDQLKLRELRKNKDKSFTVKTSEHIPIGFVFTIHYLKDMERKRNIFSYIGEDYFNVLVQWNFNRFCKFWEKNENVNDRWLEKKARRSKSLLLTHKKNYKI